MSDKKHYIVTAVTLGCIAAVSGFLVGLTNMITKDQIAKNEIAKVDSGIKNIFGSNIKVSDEKEIAEENKHNYATAYYVVKDSNDTDIGYAVRTTGSNMYGKISLIVGIKSLTYSFVGMSIVTNEQTYATTLVDNYITPVNDGTRKIEDVSCGATYGAKLVRDMINSAEQAIEGIVNGR